MDCNLLWELTTNFCLETVVVATSDPTKFHRLHLLSLQFLCLRFRCLRHWTFHLGFAAEVHFASTYHPGWMPEVEVMDMVWPHRSHRSQIAAKWNWSVGSMSLFLFGSWRESKSGTILSGHFLVWSMLHVHAGDAQTNTLLWMSNDSMIHAAVVAVEYQH